MHLTGRLAVAVAVATLAGPMLSTPAAHAAGTHVCFSGSRTPTQDGYQVSGQGCDGTGYIDVVITIRFGPAAGSYNCRSVFSWNGSLSANGCRLR